VQSTGSAGPAHLLPAAVACAPVPVMLRSERDLRTGVLGSALLGLTRFFFFGTSL
jgi:hypothetical protein